MKLKLLLNNHLLPKLLLLSLSRKPVLQRQRTMAVFSLRSHWQVLQLQRHHFNRTLATLLPHLQLSQLQQA
jgi:hypothetical protein